MDYILKRSRRKTLAVEIDSAANVIVRAPLKASLRDIEKFLAGHSLWIEKHRIKALRRLETVRATGSFSAAEIESILRDAKAELPRRTAELAHLMGITYGRVSVRKQKTRWGSCSSKGNISLNFLLVRAPKDVMDYVIIHELCHRRHMNHSSSFWRLVETFDPNYRTHRKWLREEGQILMNRIIF